MNAFEAAVERRANEKAREIIQKIKEEMKEAALKEAIRQFNETISPEVSKDIVAAYLFVCNHRYHWTADTMHKVVKDVKPIMDENKIYYSCANDSDTIFSIKYDLRDQLGFDIDKLSEDEAFAIQIEVK